MIMIEYHIDSIMIEDPDIWPVIPGENLVRRYASVDQRGVVWINANSFGFLHSMIAIDRSTLDCRHLLRKTSDEALLDQSERHSLKLDLKTGNLITVSNDETTD